LHSLAPVIHPCDVQKMCKSVQSQNQPGKTTSKSTAFLLDFLGHWKRKNFQFRPDNNLT